MKGSKFSGHLAAVFTLCIWGITFLMSKTLMNYFSAVQILLFRFLIAFITLSVMSLFAEDSRLGFKFGTLRDEIYFFFAGCGGLTLEAVFEIVSMRYTYTANTSVIVSTNPFFIGLASAVFLKESTKLRWNFFVGFIFALAGAAIISFNGASEFGLNPLGDIIAFGSAISWSGYTVLISKLSDKGYSTLFITRRVYFWGLISMSICNLVTPGTLDVRAIFIMPNIVFLLFLGIFASGLGFVFWNYAARIISPLGAGIYLYMTPIVTVISGAIVLKERVNLTSATGILVVLLGTWLSSLNLAKRIS